uniref:Uncharacterized protein n=1 Tax=Rhizophora mucronata TaxID=61149 RepID=A0A2P2MCW8_RHIMU
MKIINFLSALFGASVLLCLILNVILCRKLPTPTKRMVPWLGPRVRCLKRPSGS